MASDQHPAKKTLSRSEIKQALRMSGYPFEVWLADEIKTAGFEPNPGVWLRVAQGEPGSFKEFDVVATRSASGRSENALVQSALRLFFQAKVMHPPNVFVGIRGAALDPTENRNSRCVVGGIPFFNAGVEGDPDPFVLPGGISEALSPLLDLPVCAHWAVVSREGSKFEPRANAEQPYFDDLRGLARALRLDAQDAAKHALSLKSDHVFMFLTIPVLVLDTPTLYTYDAHDWTLEEVPRLTIAQRFDVDGQPVFSLIDVVSRDGLHDLLERYLEVGGALVSAIERSSSIHRTAARLRETFAEKR